MQSSVSFLPVVGWLFDIFNSTPTARMRRGQHFLPGKQEPAGIAKGIIHADFHAVQSFASFAHSVISRCAPNLYHGAEKPVMLCLPNSKVCALVEGKGKLSLRNGGSSVLVGLLSIPGGRFESFCPGGLSFHSWVVVLDGGQHGFVISHSSGRLLCSQTDTWANQAGQLINGVPLGHLLGQQSTYCFPLYLRTPGNERGSTAGNPLRCAGGLSFKIEFIELQEGRLCHSSSRKSFHPDSGKLLVNERGIVLCELHEHIFVQLSPQDSLPYLFVREGLLLVIPEAAELFDGFALLVNEVLFQLLQHRALLDRKSVV